MSRIIHGARLGIAAGFTLGLVQSLIEVVTIAGLHAGYLLAPRTFFNTRMYDAFAKLYASAAEVGGFAATGQGFLGLGFAAKLAIAPELIAINLCVGLIVGLGLGLVLGVVAGIVPMPLLRMDDDSREGATRSVRRIVVVLVLGELALHAAQWLTTVKIPVEPTAMEIARNYARNFLHDGTAIAVAVTLAAAATTLLVAPRVLLAPLGIPAAVAFGVAATIMLGSSSALVDADVAEPVAARTDAPAAGYNIVLISIDSLRADHLSAYGYERDTSPTIKALGDQGVLCRNNSSTTAWTLPGHMSILTGRTLLGHGVVSDDRMLTSDVPTLAEALKAGGYTTGAVVSAPYVEARYGFSRGFDHYDDQTIQFATHGASYKEVTAPKLQETAAHWLASNADRKFFLFLHYWDVHYDYKPGPPYDTMFDPDYDGDIDGENFYFNSRVNRHMDERDLDHVLALYDGEIRLVDDHLAKLRSKLDELGVGDRTIIVVTSDHGDEFFEHGRKGHHRSLYDEILRVPLVIYVPGVTPINGVLEMETSIIDIAPTLLSLVGLPIPEGVDGIDLSTIAYHGEPEWDRETLSELYRLNTLNVQVALRRNGRKVIHHLNRRLVETYDTDEDPLELKELGLDAELVSDLNETLNRLWPVYYERIGRDGVKTLTIDEETEARLRALGYLDD